MLPSTFWAARGRDETNPTPLSKKVSYSSNVKELGPSYGVQVNDRAVETGHP